MFQKNRKNFYFFFYALFFVFLLILFGNGSLGWVAACNVYNPGTVESHTCEDGSVIQWNHSYSDSSCGGGPAFYWESGSESCCPDGWCIYSCYRLYSVPDGSCPGGFCEGGSISGGDCGGGECTPSCPDPSTYCPDEMPGDGCGGYCPSGTKPPDCPDPSTYCPNEHPISCGVSCPGGSRTDCCNGLGFACSGAGDCCSGNCAGNICCLPDGDFCSTDGDCCSGGCNQTTFSCGAVLSTGFIKVRTVSGIIKLNLINVIDAISAGNGVVKVQTGSGVKAADLVLPTDPNASSVRIMTIHGIRAWRKKM